MAARTQCIDMRMAQSDFLVWLNINMDEESVNYQNTIKHFRTIANNVCTFTDGDQCIEYIQTIRHGAVCIVISGRVDERILSCIHDLVQADRIFIYNDDDKQIVKHRTELKRIYTDIESIENCEQDHLNFSVIPKIDLDRLDPEFIYSQVIKEILLEIEFEEKHIDDFIQYCQKLNKNKEIKLPNEVPMFKSYCSETPIFWYTKESWLYPMINEALRLLDVDVMIKIGFFIRDLHKQIDELHKEQYVNTTNTKTRFTVYRGQKMLNKDFEKIRNAKGGLIAFNSFLSTSKNELVGSLFAGSVLSQPGSVAILFEITIDINTSTPPFADIATISHFSEEEEILFSMHTVFRIKNIDEKEGFFHVNLELTSDNDRDLELLAKYIRNETSESGKGWERLGLILLKLGKPKQAGDIFHSLLDSKSNTSDMKDIYNEIGTSKCENGDLKGAIQFFEKSIEILESDSPSSITLANSYNNIAEVYRIVGQNIEAWSFCEKALSIYAELLPPHHPTFGVLSGSIGSIFVSMGNWDKALECYQAALKNQEYSLFSNHPAVAQTYSSIGTIYRNMGKYTEALSFFEKDLEIKKRSCPSNDPDLAISYNNIANLYFDMEDYDKAVLYHERAFEIRQRSFSPNHPDIAMSYNNIGGVHYKVGEYVKALSAYEKALTIRQQSFLPNPHELALSYYNIGLVYEKMENYSEAYSSYETAVKIAEQSLPSDHHHRKIYEKKFNRIKTHSYSLK